MEAGHRPAQEDVIDSRELAEVVLEAALDKKASDPAILAVADLVGYADYFVIVSARNPRQVRAIAEAVRQTLKHDHDRLPVGVEGKGSGKWMLVDFGDVVLHVFHEGSRPFYDLEGLWSDAPRLPVPETPMFVDDDEDDDLPLFTVPR